VDVDIASASISPIVVLITVERETMRFSPCCLSKAYALKIPIGFVALLMKDAITAMERTRTLAHRVDTDGRHPLSCVPQAVPAFNKPA
jgi:hypothetical protein